MDNILRFSILAAERLLLKKSNNFMLTRPFMKLNILRQVILSEITQRLCIKGEQALNGL
jgi:hypothetical protein